MFIDLSVLFKSDKTIELETRNSGLSNNLDVK